MPLGSSITATAGSQKVSSSGLGDLEDLQKLARCRQMKSNTIKGQQEGISSSKSSSVVLAIPLICAIRWYSV